jgi:hypothetical protein
MRQNRVDPMGVLHASAARGGWMGNRGCLHDAAGSIRRDYLGKRWITCRLAFKGRHRALMQPGRYTELFFLDEATACAAGHRPCAECRRDDWRDFAALWARVHGDQGAVAIDTRLHAARLAPRPTLDAADVPKGAMALADAPLLRNATGWWRWSFDGYSPAPAPAPSGPVTLLTPAPLADLMALGWSVQDCAPK